MKLVFHFIYLYKNKRLNKFNRLKINYLYFLLWFFSYKQMVELYRTDR